MASKKVVKGTKSKTPVPSSKASSRKADKTSSVKATVVTKLEPAKGSKTKRVESSPSKAANVTPLKPAKPQNAEPSKAAKASKAQKASARAESASDAPTGIQVGDSAPSFVLQDDSGNVFSSESLRGSPYVLYFYPKDDTPGCTLEACAFRDSQPRFEAKGVRIIGVSADPPATHARFKKKYGLTFPLLSDPEKTLAKAYGVWVKKQNYGREYMGVERSTFHVDKKGNVRQVWRSVRVPGHVDNVLDAV